MATNADGFRDLTVVSFYTGDWEYAAHAARLKREVRRLGLNSFICELSYPGESWAQITRRKPGVILAALETLQRPLLWIDVDGALHRQPRELDFALDWMGVERHDPNLPWRWHVGVQFWNHTPGARALLRSWVRVTEKHPRAYEGSDDWTFELLRREGWPPGIRTGALPGSYHHVYQAGDSRKTPPPPGTVASIGISRAPSKLQDPRRFHQEYGARTP